MVYLVGLVLRSEEIGAAVEAWPVGLFGLVCMNFNFLRVHIIYRLLHYSLVWKCLPIPDQSFSLDLIDVTV
jgi:hypothetical protein